MTDKKKYYSMTDQPKQGTLIDDWRRELKKQFTGKQRGDIPRAKMSELPGDVRRRSFDEVNRGLTAEEALTESHRCLR